MPSLLFSVQRILVTLCNRSDQTSQTILWICFSLRLLREYGCDPSVDFARLSLISLIRIKERAVIVVAVVIFVVIVICFLWGAVCKKNDLA